jgi:uncharacterized protein (UPF0179 family)
MAIVTLIGENLAKKGMEFTYLGPIPECRDCKLRNACFNLEPGRAYRITNVRDTEHECKRHEGGKVRAVEVEKIPVEAAIPSKMAVEGSTIRFKAQECMNLGCPNYALCNPIGLKDGGKYRVKEIKRDVKCPDGASLKLVLLE